MRQLAAEGLRPGVQGVQGVQAQVLWASRHYGAPSVRAAYLYDVRFALPKRPLSPRQRAALTKANAARCTCRPASAMSVMCCRATWTPVWTALKVARHEHPHRDFHAAPVPLVYPQHTTR
ncbi:hypothetical protein [Thermoactinospora rubra]|uniref:hypothetical protein n=1 Tax=Thermoactinospora rubra TaxID=1088767 RepID=UPI001F0B0B17|nr:hypothetical protein [Thermoactinospora rubra]